MNKLWNMRVTVTPIVIGALGIATKIFVRRLEDWEIRERVETAQTAGLLGSA